MHISRIKRHVKKHRHHFRNKSLRRNFYLLAGNEFFAELRFFYPVAVLAFQAVTGSFTLAMGVFAIMGIAQAIFEIPTGVLADKVGRRRILVAGSMAEFIGVLFYFFSFESSYGLGFLYFGAISFGFSNAMFSGNNDAMLYETLLFYKRSHEISRLIGRVSSMGQMALAVSGIVATICLWVGLTFRDLMMLSLISIFISVILSLFTVEPPKRPNERVPADQHLLQAFLLILKQSDLRWLALAGAIRAGFSQSAQSFMPAFIETVWPLWLAPLYRTAQNGVGSLGFWFSGRVTKRAGALKALLVGTTISNILSLIAYIFSSVFSPFLLILTQLSYAVSRTADGTLQQENFSDAQRATMGSLISFTGAIIGGLASLLIGYMADRMGPSISLTVLLICGVPASIIYLTLYRKNAAQINNALQHKHRDDYDPLLRQDL